MTKERATTKESRNHRCVACGEHNAPYYIGAPCICDDCREKILRYLECRDGFRNAIRKENYPTIFENGEAKTGLDEFPDVDYHLEETAEELSKVHWAVRSAEVSLFNLRQSLLLMSEHKRRESERQPRKEMTE